MVDKIATLGKLTLHVITETMSRDFKIATNTGRSQNFTNNSTKPAFNAL